MNKYLKLSILMICVCSLTVWSCKPTEVTAETEASAKKKNVPAEMAPLELPNINIGNCLYNKGIKGMATIKQLDGSNLDEAIIKFSFEPDYINRSEMNEMEKKGQIFNVIGVGQYPPRAWALENGLVQDAKIPCVRYELDMKKDQKTGCKKVVYDFPQFKENNWKN